VKSHAVFLLDRVAI